MLAFLIISTNDSSKYESGDIGIEDGVDGAIRDLIKDFCLRWEGPGEEHGDATDNRVRAQDCCAQNDDQVVLLLREVSEVRTQEDGEGPENDLRGLATDPEEQDLVNGESQEDTSDGTHDCSTDVKHTVKNIPEEARHGKRE